MIQCTFIETYDERYAPPEQPVLKVSVLEDMAFLEIGKFEETNKEVKFTKIEGITVPLADLANAANIAYVSDVMKVERRKREEAQSSNV